MNYPATLIKKFKTETNRGLLATPNIRLVLKYYFPKTKFSVTQRGYNCINVDWENYPSKEEVEKVLSLFDIGKSDSMTDYFYTESTEFSKKYGGVQYLFCHVEYTQETLIKAFDKLQTIYPEHLNGYDMIPVTYQNYKNGQLNGCNYTFNQILSDTIISIYENNTPNFFKKLEDVVVDNAVELENTKIEALLSDVKNLCPEETVSYLPVDLNELLYYGYDMRPVLIKTNEDLQTFKNIEHNVQTQFNAIMKQLNF